MTRRPWMLGLAAVVAIVALAYYYDRRVARRALAALPPQGGDERLWQVVPVASDYGATLFGSPASVTSVDPGDFVLFPIGYMQSGLGATDPAAVAFGQVGAVVGPVGATPKTASVRLLRVLRGNARLLPSIPLPKPGTEYVVSAVDVQGIVAPDEVRTYLGIV